MDLYPLKGNKGVVSQLIPAVAFPSHAGPRPLGCSQLAPLMKEAAMEDSRAVNYNAENSIQAGQEQSKTRLRSVFSANFGSESLWRNTWRADQSHY